MGKMTVYHGSYTVVEHPELIIGRNTKHSFVSDKIEDFNSSFYYDAPQNIPNAFLDGRIE